MTDDELGPFLNHMCCREQTVDTAKFLCSEWSTCCGYAMTIAPPGTWHDG